MISPPVSFPAGGDCRPSPAWLRDDAPPNLRGGPAGRGFAVFPTARRDERATPRGVTSGES